MCSHTTGVCLNRPDFNLTRAPGLLAHEVPKKPQDGVHVTLDVLDQQEVQRRKQWRSQSSPPDLDSLLGS